jgi:hypothetical protein
MEMARKWGSCQRKRIAKSARPPASIRPVTPVQPIKGGMAPGTAPTKSANALRRFMGV